MIGIFVPDHVQKQVWDDVVEPALRPGSTVLFAHGFCIHFGQIVPPADVERDHGRARRAPATWCAGCTPRAPACRR